MRLLADSWPGGKVTAANQGAYVDALKGRIDVQDFEAVLARLRAEHKYMPAIKDVLEAVAAVKENRYAPEPHRDKPWLRERIKATCTACGVVYEAFAHLALPQRPADVDLAIYRRREEELYEVKYIGRTGKCRTCCPAWNGSFGKFQKIDSAARLVRKVAGGVA